MTLTSPICGVRAPGIQLWSCDTTIYLPCPLDMWTKPKHSIQSLCVSILKCFVDEMSAAFHFHPELIYPQKPNMMKDKVRKPKNSRRHWWWKAINVSYSHNRQNTLSVNRVLIKVKLCWITKCSWEINRVILSLSQCISCGLYNSSLILFCLYEIWLCK